MKTLFPADRIHRLTFRRVWLLITTTLVIAAAFGISRPARATTSTIKTEIILPVAGGKSTFDDIDIFARTDLNANDKRTDFWMAQLRTKGASDLYVVRNTFDPGTTTGWHTHPGPSMVTVTQGTITVYDGDDPTCSPKVFSAGNTFVDPTSNSHVHLVRNETGATAVTIAVQLVPQAAARRIDKPNPGFCPSIN